MTTIIGKKTRIVSSVDEAVALWEAWRGERGVSRVGNGCDVTDETGNVVAEISYNGRVWPAGTKAADMARMATR